MDLMDNPIVKKLIETLVKKIIGSQDLLSLLKTDPTSAVHKAADGVDMQGVSLTDELVKGVVSSVKTSIVGEDGKLDISDVGNIIGKAKDLIGGKKDDD